MNRRFAAALASLLLLPALLAGCGSGGQAAVDGQPGNAAADASAGETSPGYSTEADNGADAHKHRENTPLPANEAASTDDLDGAAEEDGATSTDGHAAEQHAGSGSGQGKDSPDSAGEPAGNDAGGRGSSDGDGAEESGSSGRDGAEGNGSRGGNGAEGNGRSGGDGAEGSGSSGGNVAEESGNSGGSDEESAGDQPVRQQPETPETKPAVPKAHMEKPESKPATPKPRPADEPKPAPAKETATHIVEIKDFAFSPSALEIRKGDTVRFINRDEAGHTATADDGSFDTKLLKQDKSGDVVFASAGTFGYYCAPHPGMKGTITVKK